MLPFTNCVRLIEVIENRSPHPSEIILVFRLLLLLLLLLVCSFPTDPALGWSLAHGSRLTEMVFRVEDRCGLLYTRHMIESMLRVIIEKKTIKLI